MSGPGTVYNYSPDYLQAQQNLNIQARLFQQQQQDRKNAQAASAQAGSALSGLVNEYNSAYASAKSANEQRYQQMLGIADQTTGQRLSDIRSDYGQKGADIFQNLARLGLSNTTVAPTLQFGVEREKQASLNRAADELQGTKLGIMERRTDSYPDLSLIASLASALGGGVGASGGAGGLDANVIKALSGLKLG